MSTHGPTPEELLSHVDWVRALAARLVADAATADDIAQETWLAASQQSTSSVENVKAWLAGIARNRARMTGRGQARRRRREAQAARPEALESTAEVAERASLQKDLLGRVLELDEPLRSVVLLRFFDELQPPAIARRLGVPLKTVHSRLKRGLDLLRQRLDSEYGARERWAVALAPLCAPPPAVPPAFAASAPSLAVPVAPLTLGVIMNVKTFLVPVAAVLLGGVAWFTLRDDSGAAAAASPEARGAALAVDDVPASLDSQSGSAAGEPRRDAVLSPAAAESSTQPAEVAETGTPVLLSGLVLDVDSRPIADVAIVNDQYPEQVLARTAADGRFEIESTLEELERRNQFSSEGGLRVADPSWETLRKSCPEAANVEAQQLVVVAPVMRLEGRVVDVQAQPIGRARVASGSGTTFYGFPHALEHAAAVRREARTDASGAFSIERFTDARGQSVYVSAEGFQTGRFDLGALPEPYVFELRPLSEAEGTLVAGIALDYAGVPAVDAAVRCAGVTTRTDFQGRFELRVQTVANGTPLVAAAFGSQPALLRDFGVQVDAHPGGLVDLELVLGPAPLELSGRVVDDTGEPCVNWEVSILDPVEVSQWQVPIVSAESMALEMPGGLGGMLPSLVRSESGTPTDRTNSNGEFVLRGLYPRDYRVQVLNRDLLVRTRETLTAGSSGNVLRIAAKESRRVRGQVVSLAGRPLADVELYIQLKTFETSTGFMSENGASCVTDETGLFDLGQVPLEGLSIGFEGDGVIHGTYPLPDGEPLPEDLELTVLRRRQLRVELSSPQLADEFRLLDAEENWIQITQIQARGMSSSMRRSLIDGRSETVSASEKAAWIALFREDEEVARERIVLGDNDVTAITL